MLRTNLVSFFNLFKVKQLIAINNDIKIKEPFLYIFYDIKLTCYFVYKIVKIIYLFAVEIPDGKRNKMFLTK